MPQPDYDKMARVLLFGVCSETCGNPDDNCMCLRAIRGALSIAYEEGVQDGERDE